MDEIAKEIKKISKMITALKWLQLAVMVLYVIILQVCNLELLDLL